MRPRLTYANVASTLALVVAVGGGGAAVAAAGLAKDSVGSQQIRDRSIQERDIQLDAIGTHRIRNGAILGADVRPGTLSGKHVSDGTLTGADVAAGSLTGDLLADATLTGDKVADATLTGDHVANDSLTGDDIDESTLDLDLPSGGSGILVASTPSGQTDMVAGANPMGSVVLDAPSAGVAMVSFQAEFNATSGSRYIQVNPTRNGSPIGYYDWDAGDVDGLFDQRQTSFAVVPVSAGTHTFAFSGTEERASGSYSRYYGAQIAVQFFPTAGAAPIATPRQASPNR